MKDGTVKKTGRWIQTRRVPEIPDIATDGSRAGQQGIYNIVGNALSSAAVSTVR